MHTAAFLQLRKLGECYARIYSLHDVQQLIQALPWIAGVIAALCCSIVLWGASWIFSDKIGCRKSTLVINTLLIGALLAAKLVGSILAVTVALICTRGEKE